MSHSSRLLTVDLVYFTFKTTIKSFLIGRYMQKDLPVNNVQEFRAKNKKYIKIAVLGAFAPLLLLWLISSSPTILNSIYNYLIPLLVLFYLLIRMLLSKIKPQIYCSNCNEDLTGTYNQNILTVVACPYCNHARE